MRFVSLLPSATEIVADLGLVGSLVGRSHECQWPREVLTIPVVSSSRIDSAVLDGRQIDEAVRMALEKGEALYAVDGGLLASLRPDVIITQDLCKVCAVSGAEIADVGAKVVRARCPKWPSRCVIWRVNSGWRIAGRNWPGQ
jgi:iron complex transport system substrate-binding protein